MDERPQEVKDRQLQDGILNHAEHRLNEALQEVWRLQSTDRSTYIPDFEFDDALRHVREVEYSLEQARRRAQA